jgi:hypothetical protein
MKQKIVNYNPDILDCISNLSSDEVFTSPLLANKILDSLPVSIWKNKDAKFLDPGTKTGVFLREVASRLNYGLRDIIKSEQKRINHILKNQIFGLGITELTTLMSKRSLYCSIKVNGNKSITNIFDNNNGNIHYSNTKHLWDNKKKNCKYCGARYDIYEKSLTFENHAYEFIHNPSIDKIFSKDMKFDVIVGNPPYQLKDGGHEASAKPIYQLFVEQAKKLNPKYLAMIIPSRWFTGGKGLDEFRSNMLNDKRIRVLDDFLDASECFGNGVSIKGGVCYFLWDRDNPGDCEITTHDKGEIISKKVRPLLEKNFNTFIRYGEAIPILKKIQSINKTSFAELVSSRKPYGISTDFKGKNKPSINSIKIYQNKGVGYVDSKMVNSNNDWINKHKVIVPYAVGTGDSKTDYIKPLYCEPGACNSETYLNIGPFKSKKDCQNVISYIKTKFFHFLITLKKNTQHTTKNIYEFVPIEDFDNELNDQILYKKYQLNQKEVNFIEKLVHPKND